MLDPSKSVILTPSATGHEYEGSIARVKPTPLRLVTEECRIEALPQR